MRTFASLCWKRLVSQQSTGPPSDKARISGSHTPRPMLISQRRCRRIDIFCSGFGGDVERTL